MLSLVTYPNQILHTKGEKIADPMSPEIQALIPEMIETMRAEKGVGLAAQQIGKALQLAVIEVEGIVYTLINPKITALSREIEPMEEGCLSVPGEFYPIKRSVSVQVRYIDEKGEKKKLRARGLLAQAVQHEVDHLNGILILDRI
jgi:peptide deformylase